MQPKFEGASFGYSDDQFDGNASSRSSLSQNSHNSNHSSNSNGSHGSHNNHNKASRDKRVLILLLAILVAGVVTVSGSGKWLSTSLNDSEYLSNDANFLQRKSYVVETVAGENGMLPCAVGKDGVDGEVNTDLFFIVYPRCQFDLTKDVVLLAPRRAGAYLMFRKFLAARTNILTLDKVPVPTTPSLPGAATAEAAISDSVADSDSDSDNDSESDSDSKNKKGKNGDDDVNNAADDGDDEEVSNKTVEQASTVVIAIRDPVDKFVSGFNWRAQLLCDDEDVETRPLASGRKKIDQLAIDKKGVRLCERHEKDSSFMHGIYNSDVNKLATDLCVAQGEAYNQAKRMFQRFPVIRSTLTEWLSFMTDDEYVNSKAPKEVLAIVNTYGLNELKDLNGTDPYDPYRNVTERAIRHILYTRFPHAANSMAFGEEIDERMAHVKDGIVDPFTHSSEGLERNPPPLTKHSECCLTRYYANDYRLLNYILDEADRIPIADNDVQDYGNPAAPEDSRYKSLCRWGDQDNQRECREAIQQILQSKAHLLRDMSYSCADLDGLVVEEA